jgi:hypothetical protein
VFKQRSKKYPLLDGGYQSANVPGLYFAGTIAHGKDWRKAAGGFIHGFRYTVQALHRVLERKNEGADWPSTDVQLSTPTGMKPSLISPLLPMMQIVKQRVNEASSYYREPPIPLPEPVQRCTPASVQLLNSRVPVATYVCIRRNVRIPVGRDCL